MFTIFYIHIKLRLVIGMFDAFTFFRGVPVYDEPGSVNGCNKPAISAEHVDQQRSAGSTLRDIGDRTINDFD